MACRSPTKRGFFSRFNVFSAAKEQPQCIAHPTPDKAASLKEGTAALSKWMTTGDSAFLRRALRLRAAVDNASMLRAFQATALHIAASHGLEALTILFAEGARHDETLDGAGRYAIHAAAAAGHEDAVVYLLKNLGADINARDAQGRTPAMLAAQHDHLPVMRVLLARGADVLRARSGSGQATLHLVQSPAMLQFVVDNTAVPVDEDNGEGCTLLMVAARAGNLDVVRCCLNMHASLSKTDLNGRTALHHATAEAHHDVIGELLAKGASGAVVDRDGYTPLEVALVKQNVASADLFYRYSTVFTKRQLLLYSILTREASLVQALEQELGNTTPENCSHAWRSAAQHPNLQFEPLSGPKLSITSTEALLEDLARLKDPVLRPPGAIACATLTSVFSNMLRHSLSIPRPSAGVPGPNRRSTGDALEAEESALRAAAGAHSHVLAAGASSSDGVAVDGEQRRTSLERLLPHYLLGLPRSINQQTANTRSSSGSSQTVLAAELCAPSEGAVASSPDRGSLRDVRADAHGVASSPGSIGQPTNILASLFFKQGKVSSDSRRSNSFPANMRSSGARRSSVVDRRVFSNVHTTVKSRRNPWGAAQESSAQGANDNVPLRHLKSMPQRQTFSRYMNDGGRGEWMKGSASTGVVQLDLDQLHASKVDGMADFEDMMARRMAVYQGSERGRS